MITTNRRQLHTTLFTKYIAYCILETIADSGFDAITDCCNTSFAYQSCLYLFECFLQPVENRWNGLRRSHPLRSTAYKGDNNVYSFGFIYDATSMGSIKLLVFLGVELLFHLSQVQETCGHKLKLPRNKPPPIRMFKMIHIINIHVRIMQNINSSIIWLLFIINKN